MDQLPSGKDEVFALGTPAVALLCQYCYTSEQASELLTTKYSLSCSEFVFTARNSHVLSCLSHAASTG